MSENKSPSSNEVFRVYRLIPMDKVLPMLGARPVDEKVWQLKDNSYLTLEEDVLGQARGWSNETANVVAQKGTIDLVQHVLGLNGFRDALQWLKQKFPLALEQWVEPENGKIKHDPNEVDENGFTREDRRLFAMSMKYQDIDLSLVLDRMGAYSTGRDGGKFQLPNGHKLIASENRWQDVYTGAKGYGGVQLRQHVFEEELNDAINWMISEFGDQLGDDLFISGERKEKVFRPPPRFSAAELKVKEYLINERGLPETLIEEQIKEGTLYATHPSFTDDNGRTVFKEKEARCVFLGKASAELRDASTAKDAFKGCCPGSESEHSGFAVKPKKAVSELLVTTVEAGIDGLSYSALFPGRYVLSTNGAGRYELMLKVALQALEKGLGVRLAQDADPAGDQSSQKIFNTLYVSRLLHRKLKIEEDVIRDWFLNGQLSCHVDLSPHQMFLSMSDEFQESYPVYESKESDVLGEAPQWIDTGKVAPAEIVVQVHKNVHPDLSGKMVLPVLIQGVRYVKDRLNVLRERPVMAKDWNEELKLLGRSYVQQYNAWSSNNFEGPAPVLPAHLEKFRTHADVVKVQHEVRVQPEPVVSVEEPQERVMPVSTLPQPESVEPVEPERPVVRKQHQGVFKLKR